MTATSVCQLQNLNSLHDRVRTVLVLLFLLTLCLVGYMALKIFVLPDRITFLEFGSLCSFAVACLVLSAGQLQCLRHIHDNAGGGIESMVLEDELTGLNNYRCLQQRLGEELERASRHGLALAAVYIDLDRFKLVNDTFGHDAGNAVLKAVARTIRESCRGEDIAGRVGGDEFVVVLPQVDHAGALIAAERLRKRLDATELTAITGERLDFVTFSLGVASYPASAQTKSGLLRAADEAMYRAKRAGGGRASI